MSIRVHSWLLLGCLFLTASLHAAEKKKLPAAPTNAAPANQGATASGGFKMGQYDAQNRLKSVIAGKGAKSGTNFNEVFIEEIHIESYKDDGTLDFVAEAPKCQFNVSTRTASSAGPMRAFTADKRMQIEGTGFTFVQTNSTLVISNDVHTTIRRDATNAPGAKTPATNAAPEKPLEIFADHFQFDLPSKRVVYRDRVRADDPQMTLTCGLLTVFLAEQGGGFDKIVAEENVKVDSKTDGSHIEAAHGVYTRKDEQIELTGQPKWRQGLREGVAEKVVFHRTDRALEADGKVELKLPREALGTNGFLLSGAAPTTNAPAKSASKPVDKKLSATNAPQIVLVYADHLHSRSNLTVARGSVRVLDATNRLSCGKLTLRQATKESPEDLAVAEENVVVEQGLKRVTAQKGVYNKTTGIAVFDQQPEWKLEQSEGRADTLIFEVTTNAFTARGHALVRLLRNRGGGSLLPVFPTKTNATNRVAQPVEIFSDTFEVRDRRARFTGGVHAHEAPRTGAEPRLACAELVVNFSEKGNRAESAVAKGGVLVEQGTPGATNGPAVYQTMKAQTINARMAPLTGELAELIGTGGVVIEHPGGRATGEQANYLVATDTMRLTGTPTATTPQLEITEASALIWDRANNKFSATAPYKMKLHSSPAKTHATNSPAKKFFK
ncbi:MAG: hypothetical protein HY301_02195 [Verrucomicrobia bacterium]|nr:hypothetical protein [Verrucomicrobiota bacterium]